MTNTDKPYELWQFKTANPVMQEILTALLEDCGFEGFEQRSDALIAAAPQGGVDAATARSHAASQGVEVSVEIIQPQNWNARWEEEYQPVVVPGWCTVRAHFHSAATDTPHEVIITPRMSFGTGHHATTWLMLDAMRALDFQGKAVLDFGTGTGVLAILAAKLGAAQVRAIDNDPWSVDNAADNTLLNGVDDVVEVVAGSLERAETAFDVILANINRYILLQCMTAMSSHLHPGGVVLISGLLVEDEAVITASARSAGFSKHSTYERNGWILIRLSK